MKNEDLTKILDQDIFNMLGLDGLSEDKKAEMLLKMIENIQGRINLRLLGEMSEEDKKELDELAVRNASDEEIGRFIGEKVPSIDEIAAQEIADFKKSLAENVAMAKKMIEENKK